MYSFCKLIGACELILVQDLPHNRKPFKNKNVLGQCACLITEHVVNQGEVLQRLQVSDFAAFNLPCLLASLFIYHFSIHRKPPNVKELNYGKPYRQVQRQETIEDQKEAEEYFKCIRLIVYWLLEIWEDVCLN